MCSQSAPKKAATKTAKKTTKKAAHRSTTSRHTTSGNAAKIADLQKVNSDQHMHRLRRFMKWQGSFNGRVIGRLDDHDNRIDQNTQAIGDLTGVVDDMQQKTATPAWIWFVSVFTGGLAFLIWNSINFHQEVEGVGEISYYFADSTWAALIFGVAVFCLTVVLLMWIKPLFLLVFGWMKGLPSGIRRHRRKPFVMQHPPNRNSNNGDSNHQNDSS